MLTAEFNFQLLNGAEPLLRKCV